ncbi:hypothetical protein [Aquimarina agarilytica]|uniref:hypothetical protein n=1 Tax=Aquimarina agarilytica TaxID=1087449 RepID=UPI0002899867|nr:hypothetical protein [Aquimarina agarilytica]
MKQHKKAAVIGIIIAIAYFIFNMYNAIEISKNFSFLESLFSELIIGIIVQIILIAPAVVLLLTKEFGKKYSFLPWLYPISIAIGLINIILSKDPLAGGIPMVIVIFPFCIILTIVFSFLKKKPL